MFTYLAEHRIMDDYEECGFCTMSLNLGDNGTIASNNFPDPYPDESQKCLWLLQTKERSHRLA